MQADSCNKVPKVALLGAFDRFNYGDLLFPLVVGNEMAAHCPAASVVTHSLVSSDLSRFGAVPTRPLSELLRADELKAGDVVIFAGGGTIGADWYSMHANLLGEKGNLALYYRKRLLGDRAANNFSRRRFGGRSDFPWVAAPEHFPVPVRVAYNAVGGSEFASLSAEQQALTLAALGKASYLSVRDAETKRLFAPVEARVEVNLAPDSAVVMSEQFPLPWLEERCGAVLREQLDAGPYLCFQSNKNFALSHADEIVAVLEEIHAAYGLRAVLLPIGRYVGLDDQIAQRQIHERMRTPSTVVSDQASLWEIMLVIARANCFLGTSLHGNVTSQSFAVPHLGLSDDRLCKLDFYLGSWEFEEQARCVQLAEASARVGKVLAVSDDVRRQKRAELIALSRENFSKMARACALEWH